MFKKRTYFGRIDKVPTDAEGQMPDLDKIL